MKKGGRFLLLTTHSGSISGGTFTERWIKH